MMGNLIQTYFVANWKTTASGVLLGLLVVLHYFGINIPGVVIPSDVGSQIAMVLAAIGLISAKDASTVGVPGK
jgi:hypothetical protein